MTVVHAIILGIIEGLTEFLPVSSTAHLILTSHVLGIPQSAFVRTFEIFIQLGAIAAVIVMYGALAFSDFRIIKKIFIAFLPTGIIGFFLYKIITSFFFESNFLITTVLFIGGVALIIFDLSFRETSVQKEQIGNISFRQAFVIGLFQSIAVIPGVSRAAASIIGGLLLGLSRKTIVEFSFLLAVPTMLAATIFDFTKNFSDISFEEATLLMVGFIISFLVAMLSIKGFLSLIKTHRFLPFGIYRIIVALFFWIALF